MAANEVLTDETLKAMRPLFDNEVADILGITIEGVRGLHRTGTLPGKQLGRRLRWNREDVMRFSLTFGQGAV